ncbi:MAG: class I SAM-dependent methyltransferase [Burkholderiales bacterium]
MNVCPACGGSMAPYLRVRDYNRGASTEEFSYKRCTACGFATLENIPDDLGRYYASGYHLIPQTEAAISAGVEHERYKIDLVRSFVPSGRLLEIGPSWGAFCMLAKDAGYEVEAIEMDRQCCEFIERRVGVRVHHRPDEAEALADAARPDVIAAWHVLEHLRDPWRLVRVAAERLAPGGVLVLALPNPHALQYRLLGRYWAHIDAPRHLHLIPPAVLCRRVEEAGLVQELCTTRDEGSLGWNEFGWTYSLPHLSSHPFAKRVLRFAGRRIGRLLSPLESREGSGAAYTAVFRKPLPGQ